MNFHNVQLEQGSDSWMAWRKNGITATDISAIMNASPWSEPYDVYASKVMGRQTPVTPPMQRGRDYEEEARRKASQRFSASLVPICVQSKTIFRASLDGWSKGLVVEIKVPSSEKFLEFEEPPLHYVYQVQWQLMITGEPLGVLYYYYPESGKSKEFFIREDRHLMEQMKEKAELFWNEHVLTSTPPKKSVPTIEDPLLSFYAEKYKNLSEEISAKKKELETYKKELIDNSDDGPWRNNYVSVSEVKSSYIDTEAMKEDGIDVEKYRKYKDPYKRIAVIKSKE